MKLLGFPWHSFFRPGCNSPYLNAGCQYALDLDGPVDNGIAQTASILIRTKDAGAVSISLS